MRIYKMTATFGKLEHERLTLESGLNIITAPNEWGKSTWCAFLIAMLYGLDTDAATGKPRRRRRSRAAKPAGDAASAQSSEADRLGSCVSLLFPDVLS